MYCRTMFMGAPPQDAAKYEGDQSTPCQYRCLISGRSLRSTRLEAPLRLFTKLETDIFGGYSMSKCTWSSSPSISINSHWKSWQTLAKMSRRRWMASASKTLRRYFVTNTKCACILKTQCLPCRMSLYTAIDQNILEGMKRLQAF